MGLIGTLSIWMLAVGWASIRGLNMSFEREDCPVQDSVWSDEGIWSSNCPRVNAVHSITVH
jgi:hypothetical protein